MEHRSRDDRVEVDDFDWRTPAEKLDLAPDLARALYEEAVRSAMSLGSRPAADLYLEWLAAYDAGKAAVGPGRRTLTMRIGQRARAAGSRRTGPGKRSRTASLEVPSFTDARGTRDPRAALRVDGTRAANDTIAAWPTQFDIPAGMPMPPRGAGTIDPGNAFIALAVQTAVAAAQRTISMPPARLAARARDGGAVRLDDHPDVLSAIHAAAQDPGTALAPAVLDQLERELGRRFDHVRVHTGAAAASAARALGARAFTFGSHIYFADGELAPGTERGDQLLRHELTHVMQYDDGRLRPRGAGVEVEDPDGAAEVEARAAERAPAPASTSSVRPAEAPTAKTPAASTTKATAPTLTPTGTPGTGARGVIAGDAAGWLRDRANDVGSAVGGAVDDVASMGASQFIGVVRRFSPDLATLIERGPTAVVGDQLRDVLGGIVRGLIPGNPLSALSTFGAGIIDVASTIAGAATGDAGCCATFADWCAKLGAFARKASTSKAAESFRNAFMALDGAVAGVVRFFGGALVDSFRGQLTFLTTMGSWITRAIQEVADFLRPAADWVLEQLGLPSIAQIGDWLQGLASRAWEGIKDLARSAVDALRDLGPTLLRLTGLGPLIDSLRFSFQLIEVTDWLIAHRNDPNLVRNAREQMAHTFLPRLLEGMGGLVGRIQGAIAWVESHLVEIAVVIGGVALVMTGVMAPIGIALLACAAAVRALWPTIGPFLRQLWTDLQALLRRFYEFARPVIEVFTQIIIVGVNITNPFALGVIVASEAWLRLPECFKAPILNLILDILIAGLQLLPPSSVMFGVLWRYVRAGAISFLTDVREQWKDAEKVTVINRIARMGAGRSPEMLAGFVVGFFKGVVAGVIDPFKLIYQLLEAGWKLSVFFAQLANHAPAVAAVIQRHLPALEARAQEILASGRQALDDFLAGRIGFDELWNLITSFADYLETQAASLGITASQKIKGWILGADSEYSLGEAIGIAIGFIIVFALILYFSGGQFATARGVIGVVHQIAKVLNLPFELLGAALRPLATMFRPVIEVLASVSARLGLTRVFTRAMQAFEGFVNTLGRLVEELLLAIEARLVGRTAQELMIILGRRIGTQLAERLVTELGATAAERVVLRLGEGNMARLGALTSEQLLALSVRIDAGLVTRMLDAGLSAGAIHRLGTALERATLEALLSRGLTAAQLERLATLSAERLAGLSEATLARLGGLPEAEFTRLAGLSDDAFRRMLALPEAQLGRFMRLGDEQFRLFSEMNDAALQRFAALDDAAFARFASMGPADLQRFAGLSDRAFNRFASVTDEVFARFRSMSPEALERFGALGDTAWARFSALDATTLAKFENLAGPALERYGALADDAFARFAALDAAAVAKFGGLSDAAFNRFAGVADDVLAKFQGLSAEALERFGALAEPAFARFAALDAAGLGKFANVAGPALERYGALAPDAFARFAALDAATIEKFGALSDTAFNRFAGVADDVLARFQGLPAATLERFGALTEPAFARFAALDATGIAKFTNVAGPALERYGLLAPDAFARFAAADAAVIERFAALGDTAFARYAGINYTPAQLAKLGAVDSAALENLATITDPGHFNFVTRQISEGGLGRIGQLTGPEIDMLIGKVGTNPPRLEALGQFEAGALREFVNLPQPVLVRYATLPPAELRGFEGLTTAELQFLHDAPGELGRFGRVGNPAALRNFVALPPAFQRELFLLDAAAAERVLRLPPGDLAKLEGMTGFNLQQLSRRADFEAVVSSRTRDQLSQLAGDTAADRAANQAAVHGLDNPAINPHTGRPLGHASEHGATSAVAPVGGMSPVELRLRTGQTASGPGAIEDVVSAFASDAAQLEAARLAEAQLQAQITAGAAPTVRSTYHVDVPGFQYRLEGWVQDPLTGHRVGGHVVETQVARSRVIYDPRRLPPPPLTIADYYIVTMFPVP